MINRIFHYYWNSIIDNRIWFFIAVVIFCVGMISGGGTYAIVPDMHEKIANMFENIIGDSFTFDISMVMKIFINNTTAALMMIFGGMVFGVIPFFAILFNGWVIGYVITELLFSSPISIFKTMYLIFGTILPHGIFEIPIILFSTALGIRFGTEWIKKSSTSKRGEIFRKNFQSAFSFLPLIIIILFIAACSEVFISSQIGHNILSPESLDI